MWREQMHLHVTVKANDNWFSEQESKCVFYVFFFMWCSTETDMATYVIFVLSKMQKTVISKQHHLTPGNVTTL